MRYSDALLNSMARIFMEDRHNDGEKSREMLERLKAEYGISASDSIQIIHSMANRK